MLHKYVVGVNDGEALGVYYAESEEEAIKECRSDCLYTNGKRISHRDCGLSARDAMYNLIAVRQDDGL